MAVKNITVTRAWRGKDITAICTILDCGLHVLLTGGDRSHIGAVSMISPGVSLPAAAETDNPVLAGTASGEKAAYAPEKPAILTNTFPSHKENFLTEPWAEKLCEQFHCPVTVAAGVHYDNVNKAEIAQIVAVCDDMLEELIYALKSR